MPIRDNLKQYNREYYLKNIKKFSAVNRKWREEHKEQAREYNAEWYKNNKTKHRSLGRKWEKNNPDKVREFGRKTRAARKDKDREYNAARYKADPQKFADRTTSWRSRNPEKSREYSNKRRARKQNAEGAHTTADLSQIRKMQHNKCAYCTASLGRHGHLDHIISLKNGGSNWPKNLQWLCEKCNLSKASKDAIDFARQLGKLL